MLRFCLLLLAWPGLLLAAEPLRFAAVAIENREAMIREFTPLLEQIEQAGGQPVRFVFHANTEELIEAFARAQVDLAYLGPLPYVRLRERHPGAEPLLRFREADGTGFYRCVLVAFRGDAVRLAALKGQAIGLTQPLSTCGPLSVDGLLHKHAAFGLEQTRPIVLGNHENVALAVLGGEIAAGGMKESIARKYAGLGLEILARTDPLPGFALVANRATLDATRIAELRTRLLATPEAEYRRWGESTRHGMVAATDGEFAGVRALEAAAGHAISAQGKSP